MTKQKKSYPTEGKYILKGKKAIPVNDLFKWGDEFERQNRIVKQTELKNGLYVSTVFLGLDYNMANYLEMILKKLIYLKQ